MKTRAKKRIAELNDAYQLLLRDIVKNIKKGQKLQEEWLQRKMDKADFLAYRIAELTDETVFYN